MSEMRDGWSGEQKRGPGKRRRSRPRRMLDDCEISKDGELYKTMQEDGSKDGEVNKEDTKG